MNPLASIFNITKNGHPEKNQDLVLQHKIEEEKELQPSQPQRTVSKLEFNQAVSELEKATDNYLEYYANLPPEKQLSEVLFWQEFTSSLDI